jgi:peptidoglycan/LPS O-acetylase OafA/YrhL
LNRKNLDIQALRGIAVLLVFLEHLQSKIPTSDEFNWLNHYLSYWVGVDLFFAISGYVIIRSLLDGGSVSYDEPMSGHIFREFWKRRLFRLVPASAFWLIIGIAIMPLLQFPWAEILRSVAAAPFALLGVHNFYLSVCQQAGLVGTVCPDIATTHIYWSLSMEEQFYLLLSCVLLVAAPRRLIVFGLILAPAMFVTFGDNTMLSGIWLYTYAALHRGYGLIFGVLLGILCHRGDIKLFSAGYLCRAGMILMLIFILAIMPFFVPDYIPHWVMAPIIGLFSTTVVYLAVPDGSISHGIIGRALTWLGERSYSFYLCHMSVIYTVGFLYAHWFGQDIGSREYVTTSSAMLMSFLATLAVSAASYRHIELAGIRLGRSPRVDNPVLAS